MAHPPSDTNCTPPGLFRRLAAMGYDCLLIIPLWMLVTFLGFLLKGALIGFETLRAQEGPMLSGPGYALLLLVTVAGFYVFFWCKNGQTLGMQSWRLRVEDTHGQLLRPGQALCRWMLAWVSAACLGLGYAWAWIDPEKRTWHDRLSRSRVCLRPKPAKRGRA